MSKLLVKLMLLFCLLPMAAKAMLLFAPNTTVTATVTDSSGHAWSHGTWTAELVIHGGKPGTTVTVGGVPVPSPRSGVLNQGGVMNATLTDTHSMDQPGAEWKITICPDASLPLNGAVECATYTTATTGASLDLTSKLVSTASRISAGKTVVSSVPVASVSAGTPGGSICNLQYNLDGTNFGGDTGTCTDGIGNVGVKTLSGISYFNLYGTSATTRAAAYSADCALIPSAQGCALMVAPADIPSSVPRWIAERPYSGGSGGSNYFAVQANAKPFSMITQFQGMLNFRVQNPTEAQGSGVVFNIDRTHRVAQSVGDFQVTSLNTYGQQSGINRDNVSVASINGTSKGAQIGAVLAVNGNGFGDGDVVAQTYGIVTNGGATVGDQEGGELWRGFVKAATNRFTGTICTAGTLNCPTGGGGATLDPGSQLYAVTLAGRQFPDGADPLGLWQTILNLSTDYAMGGVTGFKQNTIIGGVRWITASGDTGLGKANFLSQFGGASVFQPITGFPGIQTNIIAPNPSESLGTRVSTTVTVADTSGFPSSGICSVVDEQTYEPGVPFTVVDSTHITINTYGNHVLNAIVIYGGATGHALSMEADIIAANNPQYGNGSTVLRPHTMRILGTTSAGDLVLWNTGKTSQNSFNTKAPILTTFTNLPVTLTTSGGTVTGGTITESGNEYFPSYQVQLATGYPFYDDNAGRAATPTVTFSSGCDASATVTYYTDAILGSLMLGTPSSTTGIGGTKNLQITNAGTTCSGATATIQYQYNSSTYHIYDFSIVPTWSFVADGNGGKNLSAAPLYMALQDPTHWVPGNSISSEVWPHVRTELSAGLSVQNYEDGGSNISWFPLAFDGLRGGDTAMSIDMTDVWSTGGSGPRVAEFIQRGLPVTATQGYRSPAGSALRLTGQYGTTMSLSAPNAGTLFSVNSAGYVSPSNLSNYNIFGLTAANGGGYPALKWDVISHALQLNQAVPLWDWLGNDLQPRYTNTIASGGTFTPTSTQSELACPGVNFTIPNISTNTGMKVDVYNTNASTSCVITLIQNVGNVGAWQSSTYTLAPNQHVMFQGTGNSRWFFANDQAATAASLAGGGAYFQPYQSAANTTAFVAPGLDGQVWTTHSTTSAPGWSTLPTGSSSTLGLVKADGTTITATGGVLTAVASVGYNDVTSSRAYATNYTNSTGHRIKVRWTGTDVGGSHAVQLACWVGTNDVAYTEVGATTAGGKFTVECDVPNGATYQVTTASSGGFTAATIYKVFEETF